MSNDEQANNWKIFCVTCDRTKLGVLAASNKDLALTTFYSRTESHAGHEVDAEVTDSTDLSIGPRSITCHRQGVGRGR